MIYGSVCSGVEAATIAWEHLGWKPAWFCEFDAFPSAVLKYHYPEVPNLHDMTKIEERSEYHDRPIDILVGGTPCQSFSIAGLRKGLDDDRGNLALKFCKILRDKQPSWFVWENVPGVLSSNEGRDFATILSGFRECGYEFAYRIFDAQYFGVPQRRRRVFVVGYLGDWRPAAAVLFEQESLRRDSAPSRSERQAPSPDANGCLASGKHTTATLMANAETKLWLGNQEAFSGDYHIVSIKGNSIDRQPHNGGNGLGADTSGVMYTLTSTDVHAVAFTQNDGGRDIGFDIAPTLRSGGDGGIVNQAVALAIAPTLTAANDPSRSPQSTEVTNQVAAVYQASMQVRRLTPIETERLQGFPDNYSRIPWRGKKAEDCPDGPRYKAMGNSMAVPCMAWIGERIQKVENILKEI